MLIITGYTFQARGFCADGTPAAMRSGRCRNAGNSFFIYLAPRLAYLPTWTAHARPRPGAKPASLSSVTVNNPGPRSTSETSTWISQTPSQIDAELACEVFAVFSPFNASCGWGTCVPHHAPPPTNLTRWGPCDCIRLGAQLRESRTLVVNHSITAGWASRALVRESESSE